MRQISVLVNPASGRGRGKRLLEELRSRFSYLPDSQIFVTERAGDEERLTANVVARETSVLIVAGGDGTCSRVANVLLTSRSTCALAVIPCGTGNDFAKSLGVQRLSLEQAASIVENIAPQPIDVGKVDHRHFLNSCGFGFDASVLEASTEVRFLRGNAVYIYSALTQLFSYRGLEVALDNETRRSRILMAVVSNGPCLGGAFNVAPHASVRDGLLDINIFENCGAIERVQLFASAMRGSHVGRARVRYGSARQFTLKFAVPPMMEVDGELRQAGSSTVGIECMPRALNVIAAPGFPR